MKNATFIRKMAVTALAILFLLSSVQQTAAVTPERNASGEIDNLVFGRLNQQGIRPAPVCADEVFVRRIYLDAIGTLPTAEDVRQFLSDRNPNKRGILIDRLLERDEFADYWAMKWCNLLRVKSEFPVNLWPNAVQAYHRWIRNSIRENKPYDRFVREMLAASGSNIRSPQVNFYRAIPGRKSEAIACAVALTFMGTRAESWPAHQLAGMTGFFTRVGYKTTAEWKEEIVFFDLASAEMPSAVFPDGTPAKLSPLQDPRAVFVEWLTNPKNPWFARNISNRVWYWLLGHGIIHEPDDIRSDNPASNPELLGFLERELVAARYDLKHLFRLILNSRSYQLSSVPAEGGSRGNAELAFYPVRRLEAELLIDSINQITGSTEKYVSHIPEPFTYMPEEQRAISLADASITSPFLELFGRSPRNTGLESEQRNALPTSAQALHLLNSSHIRRKLDQSAKLRALSERMTGDDAVTELYLTILSRMPTTDERMILREFQKTRQEPGGIGSVIAWALINSAEFQFRH